jgi:hypothetical protein
MKVISEILRMKSSVADDKIEELTALQARLERSIDKLESVYA